MPDIDKLIDTTIDEESKSPEQAERIKAMLDVLRKNPDAAQSMFTPPATPLAQPPIINPFDLSVALISAAFCVGKDPSSIKFHDVRSNAVGMARALFTEDGRFLQKPTKP